MNAKTHAWLVEVYNFAGLLIILPVFMLLMCSATSENGGILPMFVLFGISFILYIVIWNLPAHCQTPKCWGSMEKNRNRISTFGAKLDYRCKGCGEHFEKTIFEPPEGDPTF